MPPPGQGAAGTPAAAAAAMPAPGAASTSAVPGAVHVTTTTTATHLQPASGELICSGSVVFLMTFFGWQLDGRPSAILVRLSYRSSVPVCTAVDAAARAGVLLCVLRVLAQVWWQAVPTLPGAWGLWVVCILLRGGGARAGVVGTGCQQCSVLALHAHLFASAALTQLLVLNAVNHHA
jgi:hypothetical protein